MSIRGPFRAGFLCFYLFATLAYCDSGISSERPSIIKDASQLASDTSAKGFDNWGWARKRSLKVPRKAQLKRKNTPWQPAYTTTSSIIEPTYTTRADNVSDVPADGPVEYITPHCGKRLRVVTHHYEPFVMVNISMCLAHGGMCPRQAFGEDGGLTYRLMMEHVLPMLRQYCVDAGLDPRVELDWYLPTGNPTSTVNALQMVCNGGFTAADEKSKFGVRRDRLTLCPSASKYQGPSNIEDCSSASDPSCTSTGPDFAVGAIHILRERLDMLSFTPPYYQVQQILVKKPAVFNPRILTIFECFSWEVWLSIFIECLVVWVCILAFKRKDNSSIQEQRQPGKGPWYWVQRLVDTFFWSLSSMFSTLLDPAAGEGVTTLGGKIFMFGHWFFVVIIAASYTGTISAFLTSRDDAIVTGFSSLSSGQFSVIVRGPSWNKSATTKSFLGKYEGGYSHPTTGISSQFEFLQGRMQLDHSTNYSIYTMRSLETMDGDERPLPEGADPCTYKGAVLGGYDMLLCAGKVRNGTKMSPDTLMVDAPEAIWTLRRMRDKGGQWFGLCPLVTVGDPFDVSGLGAAFPLNSPLVLPLSRALTNLSHKGVPNGYDGNYKIRAEDNVCEENEIFMEFQSMKLNVLIGLFLFTAGAVGCALIHGILERRWLGGSAMARERAQRQLEEFLANPPPLKKGAKRIICGKRMTAASIASMTADPHRHPLVSARSPLASARTPMSTYRSQKTSISNGRKGADKDTDANGKPDGVGEYEAANQGKNKDSSRHGAKGEVGREGKGAQVLPSKSFIEKAVSRETRVRALIKQTARMELLLRPHAREAFVSGEKDPSGAMMSPRSKEQGLGTSASSLRRQTMEPDSGALAPRFPFVSDAINMAACCSVNAMTLEQTGAEDQTTTPESLPTIFYSSRVKAVREEGEEDGGF